MDVARWSQAHLLKSRGWTGSGSRDKLLDETGSRKIARTPSKVLALKESSQRRIDEVSTSAGGKHGVTFAWV